MCLGVPGQIREIQPDEIGMPMGRVSFGGIVKDVCLAYVPEAEVGSYVLVHVGFALSCIDEAEAARMWKVLQGGGEIEAELGEAGTP